MSAELVEQWRQRWEDHARECGQCGTAGGETCSDGRPLYAAYRTARITAGMSQPP